MPSRTSAHAEGAAPEVELEAHLESVLPEAQPRTREFPLTSEIKKEGDVSGRAAGCGTRI